MSAYIADIDKILFTPFNDIPALPLLKRDLPDSNFKFCNKLFNPKTSFNSSIDVTPVPPFNTDNTPFKLSNVWL